MQIKELPCHRHPAGMQRMQFMDVMVMTTMATVCALSSPEAGEEKGGEVVVELWEPRGEDMVLHHGAPSTVIVSGG